jgi:MFS family permease
MFAAFIGIFLIGLVTNTLGFTESVLAFALWRGIGLVVFLAFKTGKTKTEQIPDVDYKSVISKKSFILYIIPWIMFSLVNFFGYSLQQYYWGVEVSTSITVAEFGIGSMVVLISGYFADIVGRKRLIILGYVVLGVGFAMLSILPTGQISIIIFTVLDGIAWGIFALIFFIVVWGDLAENKAKDKYYLLGELPFLISSYISVVVAPYVDVISISAAFSLASFFLFLAVVPLMYAPETLPEKRIRERELKQYIEKAKRIREKSI